MTILTRIQGRSYRALVKDRSGATAIEYGLLATGISVVIIGTVFLLGGSLDTAYQSVVTAISGGGAP